MQRIDLNASRKFLDDGGATLSDEQVDTLLGELYVLAGVTVDAFDSLSDTAIDQSLFNPPGDMTEQIRRHMPSSPAIDALMNGFDWAAQDAD